MDNLSTANSTDISSLIGALELGGHLDSQDDGALEAAGIMGDPITSHNCTHNWKGCAAP
jgi:hypothetical protein